MAISTEWFASTLLGKDGFMRSQYSASTFVRRAFGDFEDYTPSWLTSTTTIPGWTATAVGASTLVMADNVGGVLQLTSAAIEDNGIQIQTDGEIILPATDKDIWFEAKVLTNDPLQTDFFVGLCTTDTSIIATNPDNAIGFWLIDGAADILFEVADGTGAPIDTGSDIVVNTFIRLGFYVESNTRVTPYINGVAGTAVTANIPATELALSFALLTGEGSANRLDIDWYRYVQLR